MNDLSRSCCLNLECPEQGKRGAGNLTVTSRYGPDEQRRMLRCGACKIRFSERKGTHPCSTPGCRPGGSDRSWSTSPRGAASARLAGSARSIAAPPAA